MATRFARARAKKKRELARTLDELHAVTGIDMEHFPMSGVGSRRLRAASAGGSNIGSP
jgi:hypothetical protein